MFFTLLKRFLRFLNNPNPPKTPPSIHSKLYFQNFQKKVKINLELSTKML